MALSLEDVLAAPTDPDLLNRHLQKLGLLQPAPAPAIAPPMVPPATVASMSPVAAPTPATPHPMSPVNPKSEFAKMVRPTPTPNTPLTPLSETATPDLGATPAAPANPFAAQEQEALKKMVPPTLNFKEREALPTTSGDVLPGSSKFYENERERQIDAARNPYGSAENHPGVIGKIAHGLAKAGNIVGDILAPATMALIPGTDLNKKFAEGATERRQAGAEERETAEAGEKTREKHEENVADTNQQKIEQAQQKIDETENKDRSAHEIALRKQGLKPDPNNPNAPPVHLEYDEMSPTEQAVHDLKTAQANAQVAKGLLDQVRANPDSPQNQAIRDRIKVMAQNAGTAAGKLGLDKKKFLADYFGTDEEGNAIAGTQVTPEGKPVGPKIAGRTQGALKELNNHYVKPANDTEKSYQMMNIAYKEYQDAKARGEDLPTGAQSMVALSTHLATTFGTVKGARITKDMIEHHLGARSATDSAVVLFNKLNNGDVLSPDQWEAFHDLIGQSRKLSWGTAAKEARRANLPVDFLPDDLNKELGDQKGERAKPGAAAPAAVPAPPQGKSIVYDPKGVPSFVKTEKVDDFLNDPKYKGWSKNAPGR